MKYCSVLFSIKDDLCPLSITVFLLLFDYLAIPVRKLVKESFPWQIEKQQCTD